METKLLYAIVVNSDIMAVLEMPFWRLLGVYSSGSTKDEVKLFILQNMMGTESTKVIFSLELSGGNSQIIWKW